MGYIKATIIILTWFLSMFTPIRPVVRILAIFLAIFFKGLRPYANKQFKSDDQDMLAFFNGDEDRTISGYVGYKAYCGDPQAKQAEKLINLLLWYQPNHCYNAIEWDEVRRKKSLFEGPKK